MTKKTDKISKKDIKTLWGKSGNICAFPGCFCELAQEDSVGSNVIIGEMAHIEGENQTSARYNPRMKDEERDAYKNRILLCPTHHTVIDKDSNLYTVDNITGMKTNHEKWVRNSLTKEEVNITFVELESITQFLISTEPQKEEIIQVITPKDKINKNELSPFIEEYLKIGMLKSKLVREYITRNPDVNFGKQLQKRFVDKYLEYKELEMSGDEIFLSLFEFASNNSNEFKKQAAALAVLTYFFETCDIFKE